VEPRACSEALDKRKLMPSAGKRSPNRLSLSPQPSRYTNKVMYVHCATSKSKAGSVAMSKQEHTEIGVI
jgi:hypothetical protein